MIKQHNHNLVFGLEDNKLAFITLPLNIPEGVLKYKLSFRTTDFASVFLKYEDRIEWWILGHKDGELYPALQQAANRRGCLGSHISDDQKKEV